MGKAPINASYKGDDEKMFTLSNYLFFLPISIIHISMHLCLYVYLFIYVSMYFSMSIYSIFQNVSSNNKLRAASTQ